MGNALALGHQMQRAAIQLSKVHGPAAKNGGEQDAERIARRAEIYTLADRHLAAVVRSPHFSAVGHHAARLLSAAEIRTLLPDGEQQRTFIERLTNQAEHLLPSEKLGPAKAAISSLAAELNVSSGG